MKRIVVMALSILLCLSALCACSDGESIQYHVELAMEQLGRPTAEAYRNMGLLGDPEDAIWSGSLTGKYGADLLGMRMDVSIGHSGGTFTSGKLTEMRTDYVRYSSIVDGDHALRLYEALCGAYGEAEPVSDARPFSEATADLLENAEWEDRYANLWRTGGNEVELHVLGDSGKNRVVLDIKTPVDRLG